MDRFNALFSKFDENKKLQTELQELSEAELPRFDDEVLIQSEYSSLNYKDALGVTGQGKIFKSMPMIGGIDVAGSVLSSSNKKFKTGDKVLVTGCGLGEDSFGGYSEKVRVPASSVIPLPSGFTTKQAMIIGTAGFTAALCLWRFQKNDQTPEMGPILVTGASGGVGSFAIQLFSRSGFKVIAVSGRKEHYEYLKNLGASECLSFHELGFGSRPLESVKFGGAVDNVGGEFLSQILRHIQLWGNVGSIGLAGGAEFTSTVMPHILRGVSILGISSNNCTRTVREQIWQNFAGKWNHVDFEKILTQTIRLEEVPQNAKKLLNRELFGRVIVKY